MFRSGLGDMLVTIANKEQFGLTSLSGDRHGSVKNKTKICLNKVCLVIVSDQCYRIWSVFSSLNAVAETQVLNGLFCRWLSKSTMYCWVPYCLVFWGSGTVQSKMQWREFRRVLWLGMASQRSVCQILIITKNRHYSFVLFWKVWPGLSYLLKWESHKIWKKSPICFDETVVLTQ